MAAIQIAPPQSDDFDQGWASPPVYVKVRKQVPAGGEPSTTPNVTSQGNSTDMFKVKLEGLAWPSAGDQVLQVGLQQTGPDNVPVTVSLWQNGSLIAFWTVTPGATFTVQTFTLSPSQVQLITNYTNLHVQVNVGTLPLVLLPCCSQPLPTTLRATFTSPCPDINGKGALLLYQGVDNNDNTTWAGFSNLTGGGLDLICQQNGQWFLTNPTNTCVTVDATPSSFQVSPLQIVFAGSTNQLSQYCPNCAIGQSVTITVTE